MTESDVIWIDKLHQCAAVVAEESTQTGPKLRAGFHEKNGKKHDN